MSLGGELKKARLAAGVTQEELAFSAGISRNYVSLLELDEKSPTVQVLLKVCRALGVRASKIINRVEEGP
jgi:transcriptional regulator with XRE-family HTH domain